MGTYAARPDGLFSLDYGDGSPPVPLALNEQQLKAAGHQPAQQGGPAPDLAQPLPSNAVAGPGGAPEPFVNPFTQGPPPATYADKYAPPATPANPPPPEQQRTTPGGFGGIPEKKVGLPDVGGYLQTHTITGAPVERKPTFQGGPRDDVGYKDVPREATEVTRKGREETQVAPEDLVSYQPPAGGAGGAAEAPVPRAAGGGGGPKIPKDEVNRGLRDAINNDDRAQQYQEAGFRRFYGEEDDRLAREELIAKRQKDLDAEKLLRAGTDEELRRKNDAIDERDREASKLTPRTAQQVWDDTDNRDAASAAIFLSFLPGAIGRGGQVWLEHLRGVVNDEVASQKARYEAAKENSREARGDYARAMQMYGTPEAAALDLKMRSWALADSLQKTKAEAIGTQAALDQSNINSQALRLEQEKAKQELKELERIKLLRAAQAAGAGGQAQALARQGIVKIGSNHYTVDKATGQWVPLDKAAAQAAKGLENGPEGGIAPRSYQTVLRANTAQKALDDMAHATGAKRGKNGKWEIKDTGQYAKSLVFGTQAYNDAQAARGQLAGEHAVIVNGGNQPSVDEKKEYEAKWHTIRPGAVVANMDNLQANIDETIRTAKETRIRKAGEAGEGADTEP